MGEFKELFIAKIHNFHPVPLLAAVGIGSSVIVPPLALGDTATPSLADRIQEQIQAGLDKARAEFGGNNQPAVSPAGPSGVTVVMPSTAGPAAQPTTATPGVNIAGAVAGVATSGSDSGGGGGGGTKSSRAGGTQTQSQFGSGASVSRQAAITGSIPSSQNRAEPQVHTPSSALSASGPTQAPVEIHPAYRPAPVIMAPPVVLQPPPPPPVVFVRPPPLAFLGPAFGAVLRPSAPGRVPAPHGRR